jgi:formate hydrogenlyase transcriptional activator
MGGEALSEWGSSRRFTVMVTAPPPLLEADLERQLHFERLIAELSTRFINLPAHALDGEIELSQQRVCEALSIDRSTLAQLNPVNKGVDFTHSWAVAGLNRTEKYSTMEHLPWCTSRILLGHSVCFSHVDDLPEEAAKDKELIRRDGPKSSVAFPLIVNGRVFGALAFGNLRSERDWPESLVNRLQLISQVFAHALAHRRAEESLQQAYTEIKKLTEKLELENFYLREEIKLEHQHRELIGQSEGLRRVLKSVEQVAATNSTVMLQGETGTGKELIARAIHDSSKRKDRPMVKVNCAALPASLVESELFGREKGAFTGALTREMGRFELANGSTLFLDEIGELPLELQAKLLRVLQEGEFERLGSSRTLKVDVRVIVATARDLRAMVKEGKFREDLFYRVNVFPINIPPLRERKDDIPMLVWHFVREIGGHMGRNIEDIRASTMKAFQNYSWPGNVRELRNVIERHLITTTGSVFQADLAGLEPVIHSQGKTMESVEHAHISQVLRGTNGRIRGAGGAAEVLGMKPSTLESRMKKLGINRTS